MTELANTETQEISVLDGLAMQARTLRMNINMNMWQLARVFTEAVQDTSKITPLSNPKRLCESETPPQRGYPEAHSASLLYRVFIDFASIFIHNIELLLRKIASLHVLQQNQIGWISPLCASSYLQKIHGLFKQAGDGLENQVHLGISTDFASNFYSTCLFSQSYVLQIRRLSRRS